MAKRISKIRELLKEDEALKDVDEKDIAKLEKELEAELKAEEKEDDDEDEAKEESVEKAADDADADDEEDVAKEAAVDPLDKDTENLKKSDEKALQSEDDEEEVPADDVPADDAPAEEIPADDVESDIEPEDDLEKEFDINDSTDVFLDDEEEVDALEAKDDEAEEEGEEEEEKEVKEEDDEEKEDDEEEVKECGEEDKPKKPSMDVEEHINALFNGEQLSEDFQKKARTIFEAAVREKVIQFSKTLKERYNRRLRAAKEKIEEKMVNRIDGYMEYVVEEWMEQNKLAVENGLRTEITEEFIADLRNLFEAHNIMIPKGKENLVESLASKVEKLEKELNDEVKKNITIRKKLNEYKKNETLREICEGLADTEIEKLKSLASNLEYDDSYRDKLVVIKENYFSQKAKKAGAVEEIAEVKKPESEKEDIVDPQMASYMSIVSKIR